MSGCLKAFIVVFVAFIVIGFALFALLIFVLDVGTHKLANILKEPTKVENQTGISTNPFGFDSTHPPQYDVWKRPINCTFDSSTNTATATGTVQNHSSHPSSYLLGIAFKRGSTRVGDGVDVILHVDPGKVASWSAQGSVTGSGAVTCSVDSILRSDNPALAPTTTS